MKYPNSINILQATLNNPFPLTYSSLCLSFVKNRHRYCQFSVKNDAVSGFLLVEIHIFKAM